MSSVAKVAGIIGVLVLLAVVISAVELLRRGGQFRSIDPHFAGSCKTVALQASAEDVRIDHGTELAYLSYLDRRAVLRGENVNGTVMLVDLRAKELRPRAALSMDPPDFRPLGMSLYSPRLGTRKLFVVSRPATGAPRVEIFEQLRSGAYAPVKTVTHALMTSPNAVVAVGSRQFYVVNDAAPQSGFEHFEAVMLRPARSTLLYYDGQAMKVVATGLKSAAGLAGSHDGQSVYVSDTLGERLQVFARNPITGNLRRTETVPLGSAPDNITVDEQGDLWIGAHPKLLTLMRSFRDPDVRAPAQVFRYSPRAPEGERLTEVFVDSGEQISAGSVAAAHAGRLLIGSVMDPELLDCRLTAAKEGVRAD